MAEGTYHSPICRRPPRDRAEVVFFATAEAAHEAGWTPCSECYPDQASWLVAASRWM
uniref:Ada metal-binding domain-containing protein n=1 Tax=Meridianimarinicoccus zhengii TaxID=2056810 RepID=UPI0034E0CA67